jgi:oxygen-independent coproporphyrinogen-3 oxidase
MDDEQSSEQLVELMGAMLQHGFEHYEISNFCQPGHYSRHNTNYWKGIKYLGIGPSAHSYDGEKRQWNIANNAKYMQAIDNQKVPAEIEILTEANRLNEYIMTSLRTQWGLDLEQLNCIAKGTSDQLIKEAEKFFDKGWMHCEGQILYLTHSGKLYADHIASGLFF